MKVRMVGGWRIFVVAVLAVTVAPAVANAAWLGYKNNTNTVVVIQTTDLLVSGGPGRSGKVHTLYPGEMAWDPIAAPGPRMVRVYDKQKNVIHQDRVDCNKNDIFLSLQAVQPPAVRGQPQPAPQLKFLATVLPSQAPGILPRGSMPSTPPPQPVIKPANPPSPPNPRPPGK